MEPGYRAEIFSTGTECPPSRTRVSTRAALSKGSSVQIKNRCMKNPRSFASWMNRSQYSVRLNTVSKANEVRWPMRRSRSASACWAAAILRSFSGTVRSWEATSSAFTKTGNSGLSQVLKNVDLPDPLGPATIASCGPERDSGKLAFPRVRADRVRYRNFSRSFNWR